MLKKKRALTNDEENRSLIQSNTYLPVNEMQGNNIYLSVDNNESMTLERLQFKTWGGL